MTEQNSWDRKGFKPMMLLAPDSQADASLKEVIKKWDEPPTAIQILEAVDHTVRFSSGSDFVVQVLDIMLRQTIKEENTTFEELIKRATWREET